MLASREGGSTRDSSVVFKNRSRPSDISKRQKIYAHSCAMTMMLSEEVAFPASLVRQAVQVAAAGKAVTRVVRRCHAAREDAHLDLSGCGLVSFPDAVYLLLRQSAVATCDLSRNDLRKVPPRLPANFAHLTALDLSCNRLSSLPEEVGGMRHLRRLSLARNDLMAAPRPALRPPRLTHLSLAHNFIQDVDVGRVPPTLRELNLEHNPLSRRAHAQLAALSSDTLLVLLTPPPPPDDDDDD